MALEARIEHLGARHRELDLAIADEMRRPAWDQLRVIELKRQKLRLKEEIEALKVRHKVN